jgi:hypothetical protein
MCRGEDRSRMTIGRIYNYGIAEGVFDSFFVIYFFKKIFLILKD